ncbi:MAG: DUF126 domain-containing protein [archaeon]|nr:DUF126 domain-containing protein [archaeon]
MILKGRMISKGCAEGNVLKFNRSISFLGDVNISTGKMEAEKVDIQDKILVFPYGRGSTVGSFVIYNLKVHGRAPVAIINSLAETIVATGAVISSIPMIDLVNTDLIMNGDYVIVNASEGVIEIKNVEMKDLISSIIAVDKSIILFKQPEWHDLYPKGWALYTSDVKKNETLEHAAIRGIKEKFEENAQSFKKLPDSIMIRKGQTVWNVHFFIFYMERPISSIKGKNIEYKPFRLDKTSNIDIDDKVLKVIRELSNL